MLVTQAEVLRQRRDASPAQGLGSRAQWGGVRRCLSAGGFPNKFPGRQPRGSSRWPACVRAAPGVSRRRPVACLRPGPPRGAASGLHHGVHLDQPAGIPGARGWWAGRAAAKPRPSRGGEGGARAPSGGGRPAFRLPRARRSSRAVGLLAFVEAFLPCVCVVFFPFQTSRFEPN